MYTQCLQVMGGSTVMAAVTSLVDTRQKRRRGYISL